MAFTISYIYKITDRYTAPLRKITAATREYNKQAQKVNTTNHAFSNSLKQCRHVMKNFVADGSFRKLSTQINTYQKTIRRRTPPPIPPSLAPGKASKAQATMAGLQSTAVALGAAVGGKQMLDKFTSFDGAMNQLNAVTLANESTMTAFRAKAKELGATTKYTSTQVAEGMTYLAMAGMKTDDILKAIPNSLQLAAAGNLDLGQAADIATNVLGQMELKVKDLAHVNDVLALAQSKANFNILELFDSMRPVATTAKKLGIELEELTAYLGAMANAGEKGSIAGTLLRNALTETAGAGKEQRQLYKALGIDLDKFLGKTGKFTDFKGFVDQIRRLEKEGKITVRVMEKLFGARGMRAMMILAGASAEKIAVFEEEMKKAAGTAARMERIQMGGMSGAMASMASAFEAINIAIFESGLDRTLLALFGALTAAARWLSNFSPVVLRILGTFGAIIAIGAPLIILIAMLSAAWKALALSETLAIWPISIIIAGMVAWASVIKDVRENWAYLVDDFNRFKKWSRLDKLLELRAKLMDYGMSRSQRDKLNMQPWGGEGATDKNLFKDLTATVTGKNYTVIAGNIRVQAEEGTKVTKAKLTTNDGGNLGFNVAHQ